MMLVALARCGEDRVTITGELAAARSLLDRVDRADRAG
jgi:hypothetical protein